MSLSRPFNKREKVLIILLVIILLAVTYYKAIYEPNENKIQSFNEDTESIEMQKQIKLAKVVRMNNMKKALEEAEQSQNPAIIPLAQYDNQKNVMMMLNTVLAFTMSYNITYTELDSSGEDGLVRRKISLNYTAPTYSEARDILNSLLKCPYCSLISDLTVSIADTGTTISLLMTFFESMQAQSTPGEE